MFLVKYAVLNVIGMVTKDMLELDGTGLRPWLSIHFINYVTLDGFLISNRKTLLYTL